MKIVRYFFVIIFVSIIFIFAEASWKTSDYIIVYQVKLNNKEIETIYAPVSQSLKLYKLSNNIYIRTYSEKIFKYIVKNVKECSSIVRNNVYFYNKVRKQYDTICYLDNKKTIVNIIEYDNIGLQYYILYTIKNGKFVNKVEIKIFEIKDQNLTTKGRQLYTPENMYILWEENDSIYEK